MKPNCYIKMRKALINKIIAAVIISSILLCCQKEFKKDFIIEYPSTAVVIRDAVTDIDGNCYDAVQIGDQVWMAENLRTTRYADGVLISLGRSSSTTIPYCYYPDNKRKNVPNYGYLYNWKAVMRDAVSSSSNPSRVQGVCPDGWHIPSDAEWTQLINYVSSQGQYLCDNNPKHIAKALAAPMGWSNSFSACAVGNNSSANNATGFSALPAGFFGGSYCNFGDYAFYWTSTQIDGNYAYYRSFRSNYVDVFRPDIGGSKFIGRSVRCIRNNPEEPPITIEIVVSSLDLSQNPLDNGWTNITMIGSSWEYMNGEDMRSVMGIVGTSGSNDSWLISPAINASDYDNLKLSFSHRSINGTDNRQVYYSTDYSDGDMESANWIPLNVDDFSSSITTYTQELPAELLLSNNLRFAFRYQDTTNSTWLLTNFKVITIIEQ